MEGDRRRPCVRRVDSAHPRVKVLPAVSHPGDLLAAADCFVLPSMTEGIPLP